MSGQDISKLKLDPTAAVATGNLPERDRKCTTA
jgi:hypothetical protein